ncbi:MAG TPA: PLP-dependent aminotransferase family protein [Conexibacter sp.]
MELLLDLDAAPGTTLRRRAEHALREAVRAGRLAPGARLPATRALAAQLGVSRGVIVDAYAQLAAEGYLDTRRGGGTTVAEGMGREDGRMSASCDDLAAGDGWQLTSGPPSYWAGIDGAWGEPLRYDLRPALPALDGFPRQAWGAALQRALRTLPDARLGYPGDAGAAELRTALADYLGRVRGVRTHPDRIVVTSGFRHGLDLLWTALAQQGARRVAVERPGWRGWHETAAAAGLEVVALPVDRSGAVLDALGPAGADAGGRGARVDGHGADDPAVPLPIDAVGVSPAHSFPAGVVMSADRRGALVAWAQRTGGIAIEDDYDAEFRYDRKPIGSLQGLAPEAVVYGGTASKTLAPAIRLGWLVLPQRLVEPVRAVQELRGAAPALHDQLALTDLIARGELDRHLRRQRRRYARRRDALLTAVARELPEVTVRGIAAGLHVVLELDPATDEAAAVAGARARGIALEGLRHGPPALVVGYANLSEDAAGPAVAALAEAVREAAPAR